MKSLEKFNLCVLLIRGTQKCLSSISMYYIQIWEFWEFKSRYEKTWPMRKFIFDSFLVGIAIIYVIIVFVNAEINPFLFCTGLTGQKGDLVHTKEYNTLSTDHGGAIIIALLWFVLVSREMMNFAVFPKRYFLSAHWIIQGFSLISGKYSRNLQLYSVTKILRIQGGF